MDRSPFHLPLRLAVCFSLALTSVVRAVYAPPPDREPEKDLTVTVRTGFTYDTNLFGAARNPIDTGVWSLAPKVSYTGSLTDTTFLGAGYAPTFDYFTDRPGTRLLPSHEVSLRLAHAFTKATTIDVNEVFTASRNPESLLAGVPLNPDQSSQRNQLDGRVSTSFSPKIGATLKARALYSEYRDATLGRALDHWENLAAGSLDYAILPELKAVGEVRHLDVFYTKQGELKNKRSEFAMLGLDYEVAKKITATARFGSEWRSRSRERSTAAPYAEVSAKYQYAPESFVVGGYAYTLEETSDTARFNDSRVNRLFGTMQHSFTALIVGSATVIFEPAELQGRRGVANLSETTFRGGATVSYLPSTRWTIALSYDYDHVRSDEAARQMARHRTGLNATYSF